MNKNVFLLDIKNVLKKYNNQRVLQIKEVTIQQSECIALIGNNGAGKTTLLKSIVDLIDIEEGDIEIKGENVKRTEKWKDNTSIFLTSNLLIPYLSAEEYLLFVGKINNLSKEEIQSFIKIHKEFYKDELFNNSNKQIRYLSQGNKQKVGIMASLLGNRGLILLDEPYANLDISSKKKLSQMILDINKLIGSTFIISSHNLDEVLNVATRVIILKKGEVILDKPSNVLDKREIESILEGS